MKYPGLDYFIDEFYQIIKEVLLILHNFIFPQKKKKCRKGENIFQLIMRPALPWLQNHKKRAQEKKLLTNNPHEKRYKIPQENIGKLNPSIT